MASSIKEAFERAKQAGLAPRYVFPRTTDEDQEMLEHDKAVFQAIGSFLCEKEKELFDRDTQSTGV